MNDIGIFKDFGLFGLVIGSIVLLLFFVIKWTLATTKEILKQAAEERKAWQICLDACTRTLQEHNERARAFNETASDAHRFQREEHREMIVNLNEITKALGRINGYNKE
jgi:hypothetical protein